MNFASLCGRASRRGGPEALFKVAKYDFGRRGAGAVLLHLRGERFASSRNPLGRFPNEKRSGASRGPKDASRDPYSGRDRVSGAPRGATAAEGDDGTLLHQSWSAPTRRSTSLGLRRHAGDGQRRPQPDAARPVVTRRRTRTRELSDALHRFLCLAFALKGRRTRSQTLRLT